MTAVSYTHLDVYKRQPLPRKAPMVFGSNEFVALKRYFIQKADSSCGNIGYCIKGETQTTNNVTAVKMAEKSVEIKNALW